MRLTMRTNLAMRTLMFCAVNADRTVRKAEIASHCNASPNHLGLVIHKLSLAGFLNTLRGRHGGMTLNGRPEAISVGAVARVFEAGVPFTECFAEEDNNCPITAVCRLRPVLASALEAFYAELDKVTLADLTNGNAGLASLLQVAPDAT